MIIIMKLKTLKLMTLTKDLRPKVDTRYVKSNESGREFVKFEEGINSRSKNCERQRQPMVGTEETK